MLHTSDILQIIVHLWKELDARKQAVKSQCMDNLQSLLESQVESFNVALADRKQALTEHTKDLQQKIADLSVWTAQATSFQ